MTYTAPAQAIRVMALNCHDWPREDGVTLLGLRSATALVVDAAARALGTTRAAAHADLWPLALDLVATWDVPATDEAGLRAELMHHLIRQDFDDRAELWRLMTALSSSLSEEKDRALARDALVALLAGAAVWLPILGEPRDTCAREGLTVGLEVLDALSERGLTDAWIDDCGGNGTEHIVVYGPDGDIRIGTADENVSRPTADAFHLNAGHNDEEAEYTDLYDEADPVTPELIAEIADVAAEILRGTRTP